jgi:hypothetical protein
MVSGGPIFLGLLLFINTDKTKKAFLDVRYIFFQTNPPLI